MINNRFRGGIVGKNGVGSRETITKKVEFNEDILSKKIFTEYGKDKEKREEEKINSSSVVQNVFPSNSPGERRQSKQGNQIIQQNLLK